MTRAAQYAAGRAGRPARRHPAGARPDPDVRHAPADRGPGARRWRRASPRAERTVRGPRASAAFGPDGEPTRAALGFARAQGVDVAALRRVSVGGADYVAAVSTDPGRGAVKVLGAVFARVVADLRADANMRWNDPELSYVRPIRWLLALLGDTERPGRGVVAGQRAHDAGAPHRRGPGDRGRPGRRVPGPARRARRGHRPAARREQVISGAQALAASVGGVVDAAGEAALIDEVTNLVERPEPVLGRFERALPRPARRDPHHGDAQAPAVPAGARRRPGACSRTSSRWPTGLRSRGGPGRERGGAAGQVRGRLVLLAGRPADRPGHVAAGPEPRSRSSSASAPWPTGPTASPASRALA